MKPGGVVARLIGMPGIGESLVIALILMMFLTMLAVVRSVTRKSERAREGNQGGRRMSARDELEALNRRVRS